MPKFELSSASPAEIAADLLILPFYQGRDPGPGLSEIGKALGVSDATVRDRLRRHTKAAPDPYYSALGKSGQKARRRALARRRREAKAEAERAASAAMQGELIKFGLLALVTDRLAGPKKDESGTGYSP